MIKGILFDKDGTLIDFSLWRDAAIRMVIEILNENDIEDPKLFESLIKSIGIVGSGVDPFGALAYKTHEDVARELHFVLKRNNINLEYAGFKSHVEETLRKEVMRDDVEFKEMTNLKFMLGQLRNSGIKVGLATADTEQSAMHLVNKLDLNSHFDFIGSNDGILMPKPHKEMCIKFCSTFELKPYEVAVVGDSYNDMLFARNSGALAVGVLSGVSSKINLKDIADVILPSVESLIDEEILQDLQKDKYGVRELWTA